MTVWQEERDKKEGEKNGGKKRIEGKKEEKKERGEGLSLISSMLRFTQ